MPKKKTEVTIPLDLARLLASEPEDMKDVSQYEEVQSVAKSMLRLLLSVMK